MIQTFNIKEISIFGLFLFSIFFTKKLEMDKKLGDSIISKIFIDPQISTDSPSKKTKDTTTTSVKLNLATAKKIEILSISKDRFESKSTDREYIECKDWILTAKQFKKIIRKFKQLSSEQQHLNYSYMPCRMTGKLKIDDVIFQFWLNAGSTLTLSNKKTTLYFGCSSKTCTKFFLAG